MRICWIHSIPRPSCGDCLPLWYRDRLRRIDKEIKELRATGVRMREIDKRRVEAEE